MGEASRKKLAGYVPEPKPNKEKPKMLVVGHGGRGSLAGIMALLASSEFKNRIR